VAQRRDEALESASSVMAAIEQNENFSGRGGRAESGLVDKIVAAASSSLTRATADSARSPSFRIRGA
jgi:homoaconitase/3-isopropylmalate dehydratase large subunit